MRLPFVLAACFISVSAVAQPLPVSEVSPGVYVHVGTVALISPGNQGSIANLGFVVGSEAVAVIDTGSTAALGERLVQAVRSITPLPIRYAINTHMHPDHVLGNAALVAAGAQIVGHAKLPRALAARGPGYLAAATATLGEGAAGTQVIAPSLLVETRLTLDLGGRTLELVARPTAHTDNDLTVQDSASGLMFTGDLVFARHLPTLDGSLRGWIALLDTLRREPIKAIVPGHGPALSPWPAVLTDETRYLAKLAGETRAAIVAGIPLGTAANRIGTSERGLWELYDEFHVRNVSAAFAELEWE